MHVAIGIGFKNLLTFPQIFPDENNISQTKYKMQMQNVILVYC